MEHTSKQFELELEDLRSGLLAMGGLVEAQLERALEAIASGEDARPCLALAEAMTARQGCGRLLPR